jgi:hypothetical protein
MDREINLDSIRALENQIQEHERAIIQLKRTRNSLLNVSTLLPPEILGNIFRWNVIPDGDFGGLSKGSYNFLLVCHHWLEVASRTPELWSFWGSTVQDWAHWHARCGTAPLDLVLEESMDGDLDDRLCDALQDRAVRDTIWRVHLRGFNTGHLNSIISSIVTEGEETRSNSMESFIVQNNSWSIVDISAFFSRYRLPKLECLRLRGCRISSWDLLKSQTTSLTTLELTTIEPIPTISQLLSILSANPNLQHLILSRGSVPCVVNDNRSSPQAPLHHLKELHLSSDFCRAFKLLNQLELPDKLDSLKLSLSQCPPSDLPQTLGPYLRDRVRCRSPDRLGLLVYPGRTAFDIQVGDAHEGDDFTGVEWFVTVKGETFGMVEGGGTLTLGGDWGEKLCFNIITHIMQEEVVDLTTNLPILRSKELCVQMCNLTHLHLDRVTLSGWFVGPYIHKPHIFKDLLCGLYSISITKPRLGGDCQGGRHHYPT